MTGYIGFNLAGSSNTLKKLQLINLVKKIYKIIAPRFNTGIHKFFVLFWIPVFPISYIHIRILRSIFGFC
jgi:hypothetical protein